MDKKASDIVIVSYARTPLGSFLGSLSGINAARLGAVAIKGALDKIGLDPAEVDEVFMGNVLQANVGQAPARQASIYAGIPDTVPATTVNKVCASGMKAVMLAANNIKAGDAELMVAGGMENMSLAPHYLHARKAVKLGDVKAVDGLVYDGLTDAYAKQHMGVFADLCAKEYGISREEQDAYAVESYQRAAKAWAEGRLKDEVVPVEIPQRKGDPVIFDEDEEYKNVKFDKIPKLRPVFTPDGTVTAANASTINDGGAALVITTRAKAEALGLKPLARILSYADAAQDPKWFTTAPAKAVPKALEKAGLTVDDIDFFEVNEAFSVVVLVNEKLMNLPHDRTNVHGGAVSLGHPLGVSGARIIMALVNILHQYGGRYGAAGICNGGGGASAMIIEKE
ncbi:MAG: thiolase family protein [Chlorobi bacterium]|nr:thiolase family protein [Chlorobiota bacterium]